MERPSDTFTQADSGKPLLGWDNGSITLDLPGQKASPSLKLVTVIGIVIIVMKPDWVPCAPHLVLPTV